MVNALNLVLNKCSNFLEGIQCKIERIAFMDKEELRTVQLAMLEILKDVDCVCRKHNIKYWLTSGTLLGAVRHNGFIPWDDDLDIAMLREDYDHFLEIAQKEFGNRYFLQNWQTEKNYGLPFSKVRKNKTEYIEAGSRDTYTNHGLYIDVFCFENYPEFTKQQEIIKYNMNITYRLILVKSGYKPWIKENHIDWKKWVVYLPFRFLSLFKNTNKLKKKYAEAISIANDRKTNRVFNSDVPKSFTLPMDRKLFERTKMHLFEDGEFPIPIGFDSVLTTLYGDYMTPPPVEKRENRHQIIRIKL